PPSNHRRELVLGAALSAVLTRAPLTAQAREVEVGTTCRRRCPTRASFSSDHPQGHCRLPCRLGRCSRGGGSRLDLPACSASSSALVRPKAETQAYSPQRADPSGPLHLLDGMCQWGGKQVGCTHRHGRGQGQRRRLSAAELGRHGVGAVSRALLLMRGRGSTMHLAARRRQVAARQGRPPDGGVL
ncbi:unnamed protein product, partial [Urochloa humidicola]